MLRLGLVRIPASADRVDPGPLRLHLVTADEQRLVALDQVEQQALIRDTAARAREFGVEAEVQRHLTQPQAFAVEARLLGHHQQLDIFLGLQTDHQRIGLQHAAAAGKHRMRHRLELDRNLAAALRHALASAQIEGHALPAPIVDVRLDRDEGLDITVITQLVVIALDDLAADRALLILAGDGALRHLLGRDLAHAAEDLGLFIADRRAVV